MTRCQFITLYSRGTLIARFLGDNISRHFNLAIFLNALKIRHFIFAIWSKNHFIIQLGATTNKVKERLFHFIHKLTSKVTRQGNTTVQFSLNENVRVLNHSVGS